MLKTRYGDGTREEGQQLPAADEDDENSNSPGFSPSDPQR